MQWVYSVYMVVGIGYATAFIAGGGLAAGLILFNKEFPDWVQRMVPAGFVLGITGVVGCGILAFTKYIVS